MSHALALVVNGASSIVPYHEDERRGTELQLLHGKNMLESSLPIEKSSRREIERRLKQLKREDRTRRLASSYREISLDPLTWVDDAGRPLLVVFDLKSPHFEIKAREGFWSGKYKAHVKKPRLPARVRECYKKACRNLRKLARKKDRKLVLSCEFNGIIPSEVKTKIEESRGDFDKILIIAEPTSWKLKEMDPDPLVVGWDRASGKLWLIAVFDVTPVEAAMVNHSLDGTVGEA